MSGSPCSHSIQKKNRIRHDLCSAALLWGNKSTLKPNDRFTRLIYIGSKLPSKRINPVNELLQTRDLLENLFQTAQHLLLICLVSCFLLHVLGFCHGFDFLQCIGIRHEIFNALVPQDFLAVHQAQRAKAASLIPLAWAPAAKTSLGANLLATKNFAFLGWHVWRRLRLFSVWSRPFFGRSLHNLSRLH